MTISERHSISGLDWRLGGTAGIRPGPRNAIVDVPGIRLGHASRAGLGWLTGVTVVAAPAGARAAVDVRGGGAATRETAALDPTGVVERIHAVALTGGSAFGLDAAGGVMASLRERGLGFRVGVESTAVVPIVPTAAIFDLGRGGDFSRYPDAALGRAAVDAALSDRDGPFQGSVGAGIGAVTGEMRGGVGTASAVLPGGTVVGAVVVVNADGTTVDPRTGVLWGAFAELPVTGGAGEFAVRTPTPEEHETAVGRLGLEAGRRPALRPLNTTIAVVATDAPLSRAELARLASASHDGMARAVRPVHTLGDGDVVFSLATGGGCLPPPARGVHEEHRHADSINQVLSAGADVLTRAIVHAVLSVSSLRAPTGYLPSYRELYSQATRDE